jgi:hypothetical protein
MKDLLFGTKEKNRGKDEAKNKAEESRSGAEECNGPVKLDTKMLFESVSHNDRLDH